MSFQACSKLFYLEGQVDRGDLVALGDLIHYTQNKALLSLLINSMQKKICVMILFITVMYSCKYQQAM